MRLWSRETDWAVSSRVSLLILHTEAESGASSCDSSRFLRGGFHLFMPPYVMPHKLFVYRRRSLPRVRRRRASSTQDGSSNNGCCCLSLQVVTIDQLMRASFFPRLLLVRSGHIESIENYCTRTLYNADDVCMVSRYYSRLWINRVVANPARGDLFLFNFFFHLT